MEDEREQAERPKADRRRSSSTSGESATSRNKRRRSTTRGSLVVPEAAASCSATDPAGVVTKDPECIDPRGPHPGRSEHEPTPGHDPSMGPSQQIPSLATRHPPNSANEPELPAEPPAPPAPPEEVAPLEGSKITKERRRSKSESGGKRSLSKRKRSDGGASTSSGSLSAFSIGQPQTVENAQGGAAEPRRSEAEPKEPHSGSSVHTGRSERKTKSSQQPETKEADAKPMKAAQDLSTAVPAHKRSAEVPATMASSNTGLGPKVKGRREQPAKHDGAALPVVPENAEVSRYTQHRTMEGSTGPPDSNAGLATAPDGKRSSIGSAQGAHADQVPQVRRPTMPFAETSLVYSGQPSKKSSTLSGQFRLLQEMTARAPFGPTDSAVDANASRAWLAAGTIFGASVIIASIALVLATRYEPDVFVACATPQCLRAKESLFKLVNASIDPCVNFYEYVCGSWIGHDHDSFYGDNINSSLARIQAAAARGLQEDSMDGTKVLSQVYTTCEKYVAQETTLAEALQAADQHLSIAKLRRSSSAAEVMRFLVRTSLRTGIHTIVEMMLLRDGARNSFHVSTGLSVSRRFFENDGTGDAQSLLQHVLESFSEVSDARRTSARLYWLDTDVDMALDVGKSVVERLRFDATFANLVDDVSIDEWLNAVNSDLPSSQAMDRGGTVLARDRNFIKHVFKVVFRRGPPTAALYLSAYVAAYFARMEIQKRRVRSGDLSVSCFCFNNAKSCLTKTWHHLVAKLVQAQDREKLLTSMFVAIQKTSSSQTVFTWLGKRGRKAVTAEVASTPVVIRAPIDVGVDYRGLNIVGAGNASNKSLQSSSTDDEPFVSKYLRARMHDQRVLMATPPTLNELIVAQHGYTGHVIYSAWVGAVVVPGMYQTEPYVYNNDVPIYFSYGTVATLLANQVVKVIHPEDAGVKYHGDRWSWWTRNIYDKYSRRIRCLINLHYRLGFRNDVSGTVKEQQTSMYLLAQGLRLAFDALMTEFRELAPDYGVFVTHWHEAMRIFFLRYCLLWCSASQRPDPLTPREKCMLPLHNMPEFAKAFGCTNTAGFVGGRCRM